MTERDEIVRVGVDQLKLWPGNPRRGDRAAIRESILVNGIYKPLLVQRSTGQVMAGNNTLMEAMALGIREVDVIYKDYDDEKSRRIVLVDNKASDGADYDSELLYETLAAMDDLVGTGWTAEELDALMQPIELPELDDAGGGDVLVLGDGDVRTGADWAELPQQTQARAERQASQTVSAVRGVREIMLVYVVEEHEEMIFLLEGLKRLLGGDARYPQIVQELVREAAREAGLV